MKLSNKIKQSLIAAYAAGFTTLSTAMNASAADDVDLSGVQTSITGVIDSVISVIQPIAYVLVGLVIVIMGCVLLWGGDKAKEKVKSHIVAIIIGCVLVAGGVTLAKAFTGSIGDSFTT